MNSSASGGSCRTRVVSSASDRAARSMNVNPSRWTMAPISASLRRSASETPDTIAMEVVSGNTAFASASAWSKPLSIVSVDCHGASVSITSVRPA